MKDIEVIPTENKNKAMSNKNEAIHTSKINVSGIKGVGVLKTLLPNIAALEAEAEEFGTSLKLSDKNINVFSDYEKYIKLNAFTILGGVPASGKTTLAIQLSIEAARRKQPVMFFSLEMGLVQVLERFAKVSGKNSISKFLESDLANYISIIDLDHFYKDMTGDKNTIVNLSSMQYGSLKSDIEAWSKVFDSKVLVCVDSLNEIPNNSETEDIKMVNYAISNLRAIANKTNSAVLLIAQANKSSQSEGVLTMNSFKGSSSIEYSADKLVIINPISTLDNLMGKPPKQKANPTDEEKEKIFRNKGKTDKETELRTFYEGQTLNFENSINDDEKGFILTVVKNRYGQFPAYFKFKYVANDSELKILQCEKVRDSKKEREEKANELRNKPVNDSRVIQMNESGKAAKRTNLFD